MRNVAAVVREMDLIEKSKHLTQFQRDSALSALRVELDAITGQQSLVPSSPATPPASAVAKPR